MEFAKKDPIEVEKQAYSGDHREKEVMSELLPGFEPLASHLVYSLNVWFALAKLHDTQVKLFKAMDDELLAFGKTLRAFKAKPTSDSSCKSQKDPHFLTSLGYGNSQNSNDGSHAIFSSTFRAYCWLYHGNGQYTYIRLKRLPPANILFDGVAG